MLVTFKTATYPEITMFGNAATELLKLMGQSGNVPGAIMPADLPEALKKLEAGLSEHPSVSEESQPTNDTDDDEPAEVSLSTRAQPLLELLRSAIDAADNVVWEE